MVEKIIDITEEQSEGSGNNVKIANDVVATIAGLATADISGVAGMSGGISGGFAQMLGRKQLTKGVKVEIIDNTVTIDLFIIVDYGVKIPDVACLIQAKVKEAVEAMTGLVATAVNVNVQGVSFAPQEDNAETEAEE